MNEQIIALNGLTKSYGKHRGISNLDRKSTRLNSSH